VQTTYVRKVAKHSDDKPIKTVPIQHFKTKYPVKIGKVMCIMLKIISNEIDS
jgi:hypothetical protein